MSEATSHFLNKYLPPNWSIRFMVIKYIVNFGHLFPLVMVVQSDHTLLRDIENGRLVTENVGIYFEFVKNIGYFKPIFELLRFTVDEGEVQFGGGSAHHKG